MSILAHHYYYQENLLRAHAQKITFPYLALVVFGEKSVKPLLRRLFSNRDFLRAKASLEKS